MWLLGRSVPRANLPISFLLICSNPSLSPPILGPIFPSSGNLVILTVVDHFSKAVQHPSAKKTALVVVDHVFWIHGLLVNVISDRGPQLIFKF